MKREQIESLLKDYDESEVKQFSAYIVRLFFEKNREGKLKNPWIQNQTPENLSELFKRVESLGLTFDGVHVTLQKTGVTFDYQAYKKRMYHVYPESKIDLSLVYKGDIFKFSKVDGKNYVSS